MGVFPIRESARQIRRAPVSLALVAVMTLATLIHVSFPELQLSARLGLADSFDVSESWRLFTWLLPHQFGIRHLALNGFATYLYGPYLERILGGPKFLALYLLAGVFGGAWSMVVTPSNALSSSAGASLAVFGLFGGLVGASLVAARGTRSFAPLAAPSALLGAVLALMLVLTAVAVTRRGCSLGAGFAIWGVIAHSPGLVAGVGLGVAFVGGRSRGQTLLTIGAASVVLLISAIFLLSDWAPWPTLPTSHGAELTRCINVGG